MTLLGWLLVVALAWIVFVAVACGVFAVNRRSREREEASLPSDVHIADKDGIVLVHVPGSVRDARADVPSSVTIEDAPEGGTLIVVDELQPHQHVRLTYTTGVE